jgi:hypothetical protein
MRNKKDGYTYEWNANQEREMDEGSGFKRVFVPKEECLQ